LQFIAAVLLYLADFRIESVHNPFGQEIPLGPLSFAITVLWIVGLSNALNLIDGLDGLAGGISLLAAAATFVLRAHAFDFSGMLVAAALMGALLGFLKFNVSPASIFMGDGGSLFLGTLLAAMALRPHATGAREVPLVSMTLVLAVPIADTLTSMVRRAVRGAPLFRADREHVHHRLLALGYEPRRVVHVLWGVSAVLAAVGVHVACSTWHTAEILAATAFFIVLALRYVGAFRLPDDSLIKRRSNRLRLRAVRRAGRELQRALRARDVQASLCALAPAFGATELSIKASPKLRPDGDRSSPGAHEAALRGRSREYPIDRAHPEKWALAVVWADPQRPLDRDLEIALEILCAHLNRTMTRIELNQHTSPWLTVKAPAHESDERRS
jgi:UDP-GlcNAc:undecaprenyl-phosphate GlcNAc-1-phosphate transferase